MRTLKNVVATEVLKCYSCPTNRAPHATFHFMDDANESSSRAIKEFGADFRKCLQIVK